MDSWANPLCVLKNSLLRLLSLLWIMSPDDPTRDYCRAKEYSAIKFSEKYLVLPNNHAIFAPNLGI